MLQIFSAGPWFNLRKQQYQPCTPSELEQQRIYGAHVTNPDSSRPDFQADSNDQVTGGSGPSCNKEEDSFSSLTGIGQGHVAHHNENAFYGGSCLKIGGPGSYSMRRLVECLFPFPFPAGM